MTPTEKMLQSLPVTRYLATTDTGTYFICSEVGRPLHVENVTHEYPHGSFAPGTVVYGMTRTRQCTTPVVSGSETDSGQVYQACLAAIRHAGFRS